ncbi:MAG: DUF1553 domain-containing protein [Bryobacteraceae bacterium]
MTKWIPTILLAFAPCLPAQDAELLQVNHAECALFGPERDALTAGMRLAPRRQFQLSNATLDVMARLGAATRYALETPQPPPEATAQGIIDRYIFDKLKAAGVSPAPMTDDYEFARRVTFDLTGRPLTLDRLRQFITDKSPDKRAKYIDELLASPEWVDTWTMFFGDLYKNIDDNNQARRYPEGRNAFYTYIKNALSSNKKYDAIATDLLASVGPNSYEQGEINWLVGGRVTGGPTQDLYDQMAANAASEFLGLSHVNCLLCHDGRGHLDPLSVWGRTATRRDGYQLSAFFAKTVSRNVRVNPDAPQPYYWTVEENQRLTNYQLNTTTGNRPPRRAIGTLTQIAPEYPFASGGKPGANETYRQALARLITSDIQFSRAIVNYVWREFFGRGIVEPANQFDLARLDPKNPPPAPWTIQPTHPELLDELARDFQKNGFDLKDLMRKIANSDAYQLSSRYNGEWKAEYEPLLARHFVRRLGAERITDAIAQTSNLPQRYPVNGGGYPGGAFASWAMQLPQTRLLGGGSMVSFLDSFLRGNRIEEDRKSEGSVPQVLNLLNDSFVHLRTRASGTGTTASLARLLLNKYPSGNDTLLVNEMFLTVLNRPASPDELRIATGALAQGNRQQRVEDLLWTLYNKVDFIFNY